MKIRPAGSTKDIEHTIGGIIGFWMIFLTIIAIFLALVVGFSEYNGRTYQQYYKITKLANENLSTDQRKELIEVVDALKEEDLDKDGYFIEREKPTAITDAPIGVWVVCLVIFFCMLSALASTAHYIDCRKNKYFLADLPLSGYSIFLVIICFSIWPCFIASRISFLKFKKCKKS